MATSQREANTVREEEEEEETERKEEEEEEINVLFLFCQLNGFKFAA